MDHGRCGGQNRRRTSFLSYGVSTFDMTKPTTTVHRPGIAGFVIFTLLVSAAVGVCRGQLKFRALETEQLRIVYYDEEHAYVLPHLARCFENSMGFYREFFDYRPSEEVTILFQDFDDYGYAGTSTIPTSKGASGPMTASSALLERAYSTTLSTSFSFMIRQSSARRAMPGLLLLMQA